MTSHILVLTANARARISFLQRIRSEVARSRQPKATEQPVAQPAKAPEVVRNLKWTHDRSFDVAHLGGHS
jgi:hypothetical protein